MRHWKLLLILAMASACPKLEDLGDDSPSDTEPTAEQAQVAASAVANAAMQVSSFGSSKPSTKGVEIAALAPGTSSVTATPIARCEPRALPTVSPATPNRITIDESVAEGASGAATFMVEFGERTIEALAVFDYFAYEPMTMDFTFNGTLGYLGNILSESEDSIALTLDASSSNFRLYYVDPDDGSARHCDVVVNLQNHASMSIDTYSVSYQRTLGGCISLCGLPFAISGSESGTVYVP